MLYPGRTDSIESIPCLMCGSMSSVDGSTWKESSLVVLTSSTYYQMKAKDSKGVYKHQYTLHLPCAWVNASHLAPLLYCVSISAHCCTKRVVWIPIVFLGYMML